MADRFRPVHWSDISKPGVPIIGWGIERRASGERRYKPVGYNGKIHPFTSKAQAQRVCDDLNAAAQPAQPEGAGGSGGEVGNG